MEFSKIIKNLRVQHNMSQAELARIAGVTDGAVSSWENPDKDGKYKMPRMGIVQKLADHFNINKSILLGIEEAHVENIANIKLNPLDEASIRR